MKGIQVLSSLLLTTAAAVGLGVLLSHLEGLTVLSHTALLVLVAAVAILFMLAGFFFGALYRRHEAARASEQGVFLRLKDALEAERSQRVNLSKERYQLRQGIVELEGRIRDLTSERLLPAEPAEYQIDDAEVAQSEQLEELAATCERLRGELKSRRERMADLQAELSVAQAEAAAARDAMTSQREEGAPIGGEEHAPDAEERSFHGRSLNEILDGVVSTEGFHVALVADDQGLLVDAAGTALASDELAAVTKLVSDLSPRVTELLPIGEIGTVALGDVFGRVLEVRYFPLFDARCALAIVRDEHADNPRIAREAVEAITRRLDS